MNRIHKHCKQNNRLTINRIHKNYEQNNRLTINRIHKMIQLKTLLTRQGAKFLYPISYLKTDLLYVRVRMSRMKLLWLQLS
jgi:hypothetical protein